MKRIILLALLAAQALLGNDIQEKEKEKLLNLIDAFTLLSETHDLLHIMMGEENGDPAVAYDEFSTALTQHDANPELLSVRLAFQRISDSSHPENSGAAELDALVDYQQVAFQFGYQAILKAYGYSGEIPTSSRELGKLSRKIQALEDLNQLNTLIPE